MLDKIISEECWNLDYELIKWLNEHLKVYKDEASKVIDLEFYKFEFQGKEYTQLELIDKLIEITNKLLKNYSDYIFENEFEKMKDDMYDIMKLLHFAMWW